MVGSKISTITVLCTLASMPLACGLLAPLPDLPGEGVTPDGGFEATGGNGNGGKGGNGKGGSDKGGNGNGGSSGSTAGRGGAGATAAQGGEDTGVGGGSGSRGDAPGGAPDAGGAGNDAGGDGGSAGSGDGGGPPRRLPGSCGTVLPGMACIPGGTFRMGDSAVAGSQPPHMVKVNAFQMDLTEVTVAAYRACVAAGGCAVPSPVSATDGSCNYERSDREDHPVNCVDWDDAKTYCSWAGKRLPSEAEFEYAMQRPDRRTYPWGNDEPDASRLNACGQECPFQDSETYLWNDGYAETAPVGSFPAGRTFDGLLDMVGNVWEWTGEPYAPVQNGNKVLHGGRFGLPQDLAYRLAVTPNDSRYVKFAGFRCAADQVE